VEQEVVHPSRTELALVVGGGVSVVAVDLWRPAVAVVASVSVVAAAAAAAAVAVVVVEGVVLVEEVARAWFQPGRDPETYSVCLRVVRRLCVCVCVCVCVCRCVSVNGRNGGCRRNGVCMCMFYVCVGVCWSA
jgi:hypothetical protein